ncbi:hypothetical protein QH639_18030 [Lysinibacillus sp. 1 U-2021]|uniref:hypothetical protein n=1 Tax=Lysinibacillus sp. 1 U-2021 TaxID=3039426 RepID=UPI0024808CCD|nr:hypothetical protein [Lysinibacillus sp. 1 U-2021]WGT37718.1 hypothetical protein QH639_18030 [Lysinibacillus sp. 1 U-2021]
MKTIVYGFLLDNGQLANLDFGQGSHVTIYPTKRIDLAFTTDKEDVDWWYEDYLKFKKFGVEGLFKENGNVHQYHSEFEIVEVVKIEMTVLK